MWPFKPHMVTDPKTGKLVTVSSLRAREREENRQRRRKNRLNNAEAKRTIREKKRADKSDRIQSVDTKKTTARQARNKARIARVRAAITRLRNDLPLMAALFAQIIFVPVALGGQFMFFDSLNWPASVWWMKYPLMIAAEFGTWVFQVFAADRARDGKPYATWTRLMWLCAIGAGVMNGSHGAIVLHSTSMMYALGLPSVIGPAIWHGYLHLRKGKLAGRKTVDIVTDALLRIFHPLMFLRSIVRWAETKGRISRERAWLDIFFEANGYFPGQAPIHESVTFRNQWLWRIVRPLFGREVNPIVFRGGVTVVVVSADVVSRMRADQRADRDADQRPLPLSISAGDGADQRADGDADQRGLGPADVPLLALAGGPVGFDISADLAPYDEAFAQWEKDLNQRADSAADGPLISALIGRSEGKNTESALTADGADQRADGDADQRADPDAGAGAGETADEQVDQRADGDADQRPQPRGKRGRRGRGNKRPDLQKLVEQYYDNQRASGVPMDKITGPAAAVATGASEQYARGILADKKRAEQERTANETAKK